MQPEPAPMASQSPGPLPVGQAPGPAAAAIPWAGYLPRTPGQGTSPFQNLPTTPVQQGGHGQGLAPQTPVVMHSQTQSVRRQLDMSAAGPGPLAVSPVAQPGQAGYMLAQQQQSLQYTASAHPLYQTPGYQTPSPAGGALSPYAPQVSPGPLGYAPQVQ